MNIFNCKHWFDNTISSGCVQLKSEKDFNYVIKCHKAPYLHQTYEYDMLLVFIAKIEDVVDLDAIVLINIILK
jgi:hypothetical protein